MSPRPLIIALALLAAAASGAKAEEGAIGEEKLIDLTCNLAQDAAHIRPVAWDNVPGAALLGTIRAGVVILGRDRPSAQPIAQVTSVTNSDVLATAHDLTFGSKTGPDITLLTGISQALELEIRFFSVDGWNATRTFDETGGVRFHGFGMEVTAPGERLEYSSRLYSVEVNARPRVAAGMPIVLGFRSLQLHERFQLWDLVVPSDMLALGNHTSNFLYGFQVGVEPYLFGGNSPLRIEGLLKGGIYGNAASQGTFSPLSATSIDVKGWQTSFMGEAGLMVDYCFSQSFAARAGYEIMYVHGVALAPDQSTTTAVLAPAATVHASAGALYQGATVSLEFMF